MRFDSIFLRLLVSSLGHSLTSSELSDSTPSAQIRSTERTQLQFWLRSLARLHHRTSQPFQYGVSTVCVEAQKWLPVSLNKRSPVYS